MSQGQSRKAQKIASDSTPRATSGLLLDSSTQDMNVDTSGQAAMGTFSDTSGQAAMGTLTHTSAKATLITIYNTTDITKK